MCNFELFAHAILRPEFQDLVVPGPVILLTLRQSSILGAQGFDLSFLCDGDEVKGDETYTFERPYSTFTYPPISSALEDEINQTKGDGSLGPQNITVFAGISYFSIRSGRQVSINFISNANKTTKVGNDYKITLYEPSDWNSSYTFTPLVECIVVKGSLEDECNFHKKYTFADFHSESEGFEIKSKYLGYIGVVKPLGTIQNRSNVYDYLFSVSWSSGTDAANSKIMLYSFLNINF